MARRRSRRNSRLETAGAAVGRTLGRLAAQWAALDRQRTDVGVKISRLVKSMTGTSLPDAFPAGTPRRRGGRPKGFKTTAATRRKLRAAWKRRKAAAAKNA
jgi:hypothetical protein